MPSAEYSHTATIALPPGPAWEAMQQPDLWVGVGPIERVHGAVFDAEGALAGYAWDAEVAGRRFSGTARTLESVRGETMSLSLDSAEIGARLAARLAPDGEGSALAVTITVASRGMLAGLFWGIISQAVGGAVADQVEDFAARIAAAAPGGGPA